jgi:hypothetical protein
MNLMKIEYEQTFIKFYNQRVKNIAKYSQDFFNMTYFGRKLLN